MHKSMARYVNLSKRIKACTGDKWPGVNYFSTLRTGGASQGVYASLNLGTHVDDELDQVLQNRALLTQLLPAKPLWLNQVHSDQVFVADTPIDNQIITADASVTRLKNQPLVIMTADCLPIVISDKNAQALAVAHAGWRGLLNGIVENTIFKLQKVLTHKTELQAWIGPSISQQAFEVGDEVKQAFIAKFPEFERHFIFSRSALMRADNQQKNHYMANLPAMAENILYKNNVQSVNLSNECTYMQADKYFSYRREGQTGRIATIAWLGESGLPELT